LGWVRAHIWVYVRARMDQEFITIPEAAREAGYRTPSNLYAAAREGKLKVAKFGARGRLTTRAWLQEYLASIRHEPHRGQARADGEETSQSPDTSPTA
jgi:hypothetical protein